MVDIPITVAAPGATQAAQQIRDTAKATAEAATSNDKLTRSSKAAADARTKEAASEKNLAAERKRAANASRGVIQRGASLAGGGRIGAGIGALAGGGAMSAGQAGAFAGIAVFTAAIGTLNAVLERSQKVALAAADALGAEAATKLQNQRTLGSNALGAFKNKGEVVGQLGVLGGETAVKQSQEMEAAGISDAANALLILIKGGQNFVDTQLETVNAAKTSLISMSDAAKMQVENGGRLSARDIIGQSLGRSVSDEDMGNFTRNAANNKTLGTLRTVNGIEAKTQNQLLAKDDLAIGAASAAAAETLSPGTRALLDALATQTAQLDEMKRLAELQWAATAVWKNLTTTEGSLNVQITRKMADNAAASGITASAGMPAMGGSQ